MRTIEERAEDGENERNDEAKERNLKNAWDNMRAEFDKRVKVEDLIPDDPDSLQPARCPGVQKCAQRRLFRHGAMGLAEVSTVQPTLH